MIKRNIKKEILLSKLSNVNSDYYEVVMNHEALEDVIGKEKEYLFKALRYVPNKVIKRWIKESSKEIKKEREIKENEKK